MTGQVRHGQSLLPQKMTQCLPLSEGHFHRLCQLIYQRAGIVLAPHKRDMVYNRLVHRLRALDLVDFGKYIAMLESDTCAAEWQAFINALTTNLTAFFRESHHFPVLAEHALQRKGEYKVWSAAASSGEEPYSIAITLADALGVDSGCWKIFASDIDTQVLGKAQAGVYRLQELKALSAQQLQRYFMRGTGPHEGYARVCQTFFRQVEFAAINLMDAHLQVPGPFDAIFCRNVMIYFDKKTQQAILRRFIPLLKPGGLLFTGHSENFSQVSRELVLKGQTVYALSQE